MLLGLLGRDRQRRPDIRIPEPETRVRWHYANHRITLIIECDGPAQDVGIAAEAPLPQPIAEDHYPVVSGPIFFRQEVTTNQRSHAEHGKKAMSSEHAAYPLGIVRADEVKILDGNGFEWRKDCALLLPGEEIARRDL